MFPVRFRTFVHAEITAQLRVSPRFTGPERLPWERPFCHRPAPAWSLTQTPSAQPRGSGWSPLNHWGWWLVCLAGLVVFFLLSVSEHLQGQKVIQILLPQHPCCARASRAPASLSSIEQLPKHLVGMFLKHPYMWNFSHRMSFGFHYVKPHYILLSQNDFSCYSLMRLWCQCSPRPTQSLLSHFEGRI